MKPRYPMIHKLKPGVHKHRICNGEFTPATGGRLRKRRYVMHLWVVHPMSASKAEVRGAWSMEYYKKARKNIYNY